MNLRILYDVKRMQPGCVLLAAAYGCHISLCLEFPTRLWLTAPTPDLAVYSITKEQLDALVKKTLAAHPEKTNARHS